MKENIYSVEELGLFVSKIVSKESGNILDSSKQSMVLSRLKKRLLDLGGLSPERYFHYLEENYREEVSHLVSLLTTHHTFFFREFCHFEFIGKELENIANAVRERGERVIRIFSAGCSRGHEVYSLAMFLSFHMRKMSDMDFEIYGTDIDPVSVKVAANGVYLFKEVKSIPQIYLENNWQRGTGEISHFAKVKKELKAKCHFGVMNLLGDFSEVKNKKFDLILCRNVFIYLKQNDILNIVNKMQSFLHQDGYLITGLSESLKNLDIEKVSHGLNTYSFNKKEKLELVTKPLGSIFSPIPKPIKMLIVDDSPLVVKLLKRIFTADINFEVVGSATNGLEAIEFLENNKVDAMTLDIHMPEMDGVEYLKANFTKNHPKVVVVSSASREDSRYAQETLRFGASDFVEKPVLNNIHERADEIKNKIKMTFYNDHEVLSRTQVDKDFSYRFEVGDINNTARILFGGYSDLVKIEGTLGALEGDQPPVCIFFEGNENFLEIIGSQMNIEQKIEIYTGQENLDKNTVYLCDFKKDFIDLKVSFKKRRVSCAIFGICSQAVVNEIVELDSFQLLLEDNKYINESLREVATDIFPWTSFAHIATEYLAKK